MNNLYHLIVCHSLFFHMQQRSQMTNSVEWESIALDLKIKYYKLNFGIDSKYVFHKQVITLFF